MTSESNFEDTIISRGPRAGLDPMPSASEQTLQAENQGLCHGVVTVALRSPRVSSCWQALTGIGFKICQWTIMIMITVTTNVKTPAPGRRRRRCAATRQVRDSIIIIMIIMMMTREFLDSEALSKLIAFLRQGYFIFLVHNFYESES